MGASSAPGSAPRLLDFLDAAFRDQLTGADSPAHAYELLHAAEAIGFNYFLETDPVREHLARSA